MAIKPFSNVENYQALTEATEEQFINARKEAERWMSEGGGRIWYESSARSAVTEYILFTQGLRAKRQP